MENQDVYERLANHLSNVGMGYPVTETLLDILKEHLDPSEAEIVLALPTGVIPFSTVSVEELSSRVAISRRIGGGPGRSCTERRSLRRRHSIGGERVRSASRGVRIPPDVLLERRRHSPCTKDGAPGSEVF